MNEPTADGSEHDEGPSALVQEAACAERVIVLKVRVPGRTSFVIVGSSRALAGAGLMASEARRTIWGGRLPSGATRQRAREEALTGARVVALGTNEIHVDQHGLARVIRAEAGRVVVTDAPVPAHAKRFLSLSDEERGELEARGLELAHAVATDVIELRRVEVARVLERATARIERRREAIRGDLAKIAQADRIAA
ncbi:MAG TPA: hypothetical protein VM580_32305, partial [Labilithrix sp.]|nr:hypothetical protein [Labilithrix sp.]